ncbi:MAG: thioredoxin domain-containing protein, partial [Candidatus Hydrogenedentota bacterium]
IPLSSPYPDPAKDRLLASAHAKLLRARARREKPRIDDKVIASWNGLAIAALARGWQVLGDSRYLSAAQKAAGFIRDSMTRPDGRLTRTWRSDHRAMLDDYAFLIHGLIELYQSDFDPQWLSWAEELQKIQDRDFADARGGFFLDDTSDTTLFTRLRDDDDVALPGGNSMAVLNLLRLADLLSDPRYRATADSALAAAAVLMRGSAFAYPALLIALDYRLDRSKEIAIAGRKEDPGTRALLAALRGRFLPNQVVALADDTATSPLMRNKPMLNGRATAYVCEQGSCRLPTTEPAQALAEAGTLIPLDLK